MQCVSRCVEKALTMQGADPGSTAESPAFCRFFLILCCLVYLSCQVNRHKTHRWITSVFIEVKSGNLFREAVSCWGSTTSWSMFAFIIHAQCDRHRHGHKWSSRSGLDKCFWTCNAAQHVFCPAIPKHEISMVHVEALEQSSWACAAMHWLCCLSWGCLSCNYFNVKMGWLVLDLFFLQLVLLFLRKSSILFEFEGPQPLTGELLSHCSCHMPGRCNDRQRGARHDVLFCEHLLFVPWQIRKGTLGQAKLLFQNLWSWFKRPLFCLLLHWYEHPNHKLHARVLFDTICKMQYLGISEYLIPLSQIVLTCSDLSHSPEDAVILIILRWMSLSTPVFSWTYIWLSWINIIAAYTKVTEKTLSSLSERHCRISQRHCWVSLQKGPLTQYEFHYCHNVVF